MGKTRVGKQVCTALSGRTFLQGIQTFVVKAGFVSNPSFLGDGYEGTTGKIDQNIQCLAKVLVRAFFSQEDAANLSHSSLKAVVAKLRSEFDPNVAIVLHVDEYLVNVKAINALVFGTVRALTDSEFNLRVTLVLTGMKPVVGIHTLAAGSRFTLKTHVLSPLPTDEVKRSLGLAVGIAPNVEWDYKLETLVEMCGGYPASLVALLYELQHVDDQVRLQTEGLVSLLDAKGVYARLQGNLENRYGDVRWLELLYPTVPVNERKLSLDSQHLLRRVVLFSMAAFPVDRADHILLSKALTYAKLEESGLVVLTQVGQHWSIWMPLLAVVLVNNRLKVVDWEMLDDPFNVDFKVQERLALASLSLNLRALTEARGAGESIPVSLLRPGSQMSQGDALMIILPSQIKCQHLGMFESGQLRTGEDATGPPPSTEDGTILMMPTNEAGIDGAAVFSGTLEGQVVIVVFLSQSKSLMPTSSVTVNRLEQAQVTSILCGMEMAGKKLATSWLQSRLTKQDVVFVFDIFTDKEPAPRFSMSAYAAPRGSPTRSSSAAKPQSSVKFVTTRVELPHVLGPVLAIRASLKRPIESVASLEKKKSKAGEEDMS